MMIEALIGLCLLGAGVVMFTPDRYAAKVAFGWSLLPLALSGLMLLNFDGTGNALLGGTLAFEEQFTWITLGPYDLSWHVGLDGISMPLVALSTLLTSLAILSAWTPITKRQNQFYGLVLLLEASLVGVFAALDFFLYFVFWEAVLIPMYFLVGIWGGARRKYAAIKFFVYTNIASLVLFIGFFGLVFGLGDSISSLDLPEIAQALRAGELGSLAGGLIGPELLALSAFVAMFIGFGVKVPIVPFHTWLPDAHVEAPTPISVLLAGVLLKMGTYALLRFNFTMLPEVARSLAVPIAALAVISVIYGALLALGQSDLKRVVAYSSVSSMGYVILGLVAYTSYGLGGATFQMVSHGLISGLMFACVGVIYNVTHTREIGDMAGIAERMPLTVGAFVAGAFAYAGLPLMAGFAAEFFIFVGAFQSTVIAGNGMAVMTALAMFGIVIVAGYLLWAMQRSLFGPFEFDGDYDVTRAARHDVVPLVVLIIVIIALGTFPDDTFFRMITDAVGPLVDGGPAEAAIGSGGGSS
ncbi:oxidoreductase [Haloglomus irregulare]|jgi:NADH-quinone oxidoreductase subunit M|uniref:Oxidoreductase n=1 Tax=Haloglomus irregulare TaxID=2234134 RepID=A0A554NAK4_9EURY|nr:NuoM family protein [Haloglomus irregulare]TSD14395.1 oxidoreductase [Haloglomus irregulare]